MAFERNGWSVIAASQVGGVAIFSYVTREPFERLIEPGYFNEALRTAGPPRPGDRIFVRCGDDERPACVDLAVLTIKNGVVEVGLGRVMQAHTTVEEAA